MRKFAILCMLAMTTMAFAKSPKPEQFLSVRANDNVALDSNPDSEFWRGAAPVHLQSDKWGKPARSPQTEVRSRWTKDNLYFLFTCPYQELNLNPHPDTKAETNELWNWDVAEVFIGSDFHNIRSYKEFEISPQGEWVDLDIKLDPPNPGHDWTWNSGFQVSARIDRTKKIWYGAMKIPFASVGPQVPHDGTLYRVNLFRTEGAAPNVKENVWQPTMSETFHVPERFGELKLVNDK